MAISSTGPTKASDIRSEFDTGSPVKMGDLRGAEVIGGSLPSGVIKYSDMRGKTFQPYLYTIGNLTYSLPDRTAFCWLGIWDDGRLARNNTPTGWAWHKLADRLNGTPGFGAGHEIRMRKVSGSSPNWEIFPVANEWMEVETTRIVNGQYLQPQCQVYSSDNLITIGFEVDFRPKGASEVYFTAAFTLSANGGTPSGGGGGQIPD